jgi:hypothetical protein
MSSEKQKTQPNSWRYGRRVGGADEGGGEEEEEEVRSGASTHAADVSFPYKRSTTPAMLFREMRDVRRLVAGRRRTSPRNAVVPRKPRYMRPSTSKAMTCRRINSNGPPVGVCVTDIETYHRNYCEGIDTSNDAGVMLYGQVNNRYSKFWHQVPKFLQSHRNQFVQAHKRYKVDPNSLHNYVTMAPPPLNNVQLKPCHNRALMRLYDRVVKLKPEEGDETPIDPEAGMFYRCDECDCDTIRYRYTTQCPSCHKTVATVSSRDRNFKEFEQCSTQSIATYKRINHFNEWLARTQGIEQRAVPDVVLQAVASKLALVREPIVATTCPKVVYNMVRDALALSRFQDYFEHVPQIMKKLTPLQPPVLVPGQMLQIRAVFTAIQGPFERRKPKGRRNFLSYSYVIYKLCELMEIDEMLPFCPLFKSIANQRNADSIWKAMCQDMGYEFIPTV